MDPRFARFPTHLAERARTLRLGPTGVPALLAHPDWSTPSPVVVWMHGRTVNKELDPGRYLRWLRAGIAVCAIDLPGHGERADPGADGPERTLDVLEAVIPEIDGVVGALAASEHGGRFDPERLAIGGMSAGGMAALRRLCDAHPFRCAVVEGTTGDLGAYYRDGSGHRPDRVAALDPMRHLEGWRPIPLLALHSEADQVVPVGTQRGFIAALRERYARLGASAQPVEFQTWSGTGAPQEHNGFGRFANDAKNAQTAFLSRWLGMVPPPPPADA